MKEIWRPVDKGGFFNGLYEVSNFGRFKMCQRVLKTARGKGWRLSVEKIVFGTERDGYRFVALKKDGVKKQIDVHVLVARAFIPNPDNLPEVNHLNGIRHDNRVENLEWCTRKQNAQHAARMGFLNPVRGERHRSAKLSEEQVKEIRRLYKLKHTQSELAAKFAVNRFTIGDIVNRATWRHVE